MLIEECWKNNILLLGISKDTALNKFKNHVMPICINNNIWPNCTLTQDNINNIPNTDRMFLQSLTMFNHDKISIPWALAEYDSAFMMAVPDSKKPNGYVSGTAKNKITPSHLFLRSFIQLQDSKENGMLRSNVLSLDRLVYQNFELEQKEVITELLHQYIYLVTATAARTNQTYNLFTTNMQPAQEMTRRRRRRYDSLRSNNRSCSM